MPALLYTVIAAASFLSLAVCDCPWQGQVHSLGSTWQLPTLPCVNCTCTTGPLGESKVSCVSQECPRLNCSESKKKMDPNRCCPYCEVVAEGDSDGAVEKLGCGKHNHGDVFTSNSTGISRNNEDQCVNCVCQNGKALCHLKSCTIPKSCTTFITSSDDCCPKCADLSEISWDDPALAENKNAVLNAHLDEDDCSEGGSIRRNGTTWHPTIGSFGQIDCITCTCLEGEIRCKKDCIPDDKLPCSNPKKPNGACCKQCPDNEEADDKKNKKGPNDKNRKDDSRKRRGRKCRKRKDGRPCRRKGKGKGRKGRNRKEKVTVAPIQTGIDLTNLCIPKRTEYLVYKSIGKTEVFLAFDNLQEDRVEVFRWTVSKGSSGSVVSSIDPEFVPAADFRRQINNTNVVGTTGKNHYRKFKRRLKRKLQKCTDSCKPKSLVSLLKRVKVHLLKFGEECKT